MNKKMRYLLTLASSLSNEELDQFLDSINSRQSSITLSDRTKNGVKCPHCGSVHTSRNGKTHGKQRFICVSCHKTFTESTNSIFASKKLSDGKIRKVLSCMMHGYSVRKTAEEAGVDKTTAFLWRHKILDALAKQPEKLSGIVEADETFFCISYKGNHNKDGFVIPRKSKKRGEPAQYRGLSHEQVCVPCGLDRNGHAISKIACTGRVSSKALAMIFENQIEADATMITDKMNSYTRFAHNAHLHLVQLKPDAGKKAVVKGIYHIQNINSYHSGLKSFMRRFNGVSTKHLNNYLTWYKWIRGNKALAQKSDAIMDTVIITNSKTVRVDLSHRPVVPVLAA